MTMRLRHSERDDTAVSGRTTLRATGSRASWRQSTRPAGRRDIQWIKSFARLRSISLLAVNIGFRPASDRFGQQPVGLEQRFDHFDLFGLERGIENHGHLAIFIPKQYSHPIVRWDENIAEIDWFPVHELYENETHMPWMFRGPFGDLDLGTLESRHGKAARTPERSPTRKPHHDDLDPFGNYDESVSMKLSHFVAHVRMLQDAREFANVKEAVREGCNHFELEAEISSLQPCEARSVSPTEAYDKSWLALRCYSTRTKILHESLGRKQSHIRT